MNDLNFNYIYTNLLNQKADKLKVKSQINCILERAKNMNVSLWSKNIA